ncbi:MupG family TIM beta-alpha barrel fold protein [Brevibacillus fulvus]|uniref:DUF871 domain-containing protein n=1 Tax=Brevibacillus fulvus TaxID=1125967 RepID=A0A938Y5K9_9BACL|nr:MupG family TIM beta-alpha barrel fold protein [Brevibacillus fulvus]MBM7591987.1 hypothetical protein [Brevibacillus fulvus]
MIGISFYLRDANAADRLRHAGRLGVKAAFTSLHIPEESGDLVEHAKQLLALAHSLGIAVYADVSRSTLGHLGIGTFEQLTELGVAGLRLDDEFALETTVRLAKTFRIALNASTVFATELRSLLDSGLQPEQLIGWHNFYPRRETGLDDQFFRKQTELFRSCGIPVAAFVPGAGEKRGPLFEGLPTLERHRTADPYAAAVELWRGGVDTVYIGDPDPGEGVLERMTAFQQTGRLVLRIYSDTLGSGEYRLRPDLGRDVLRFMDTRSAVPIPPQETLARPRGTLTRDNELYGRYCGELQIARTDLPADERVNVVGRVCPADLPLLDLLEPGAKVYLEAIPHS